MPNFPSATYIGHEMPHEAFYRNLPLSSSEKLEFSNTIKRIVIANKLTAENMMVSSEGGLKEILVLRVELNGGCSNDILRLIAQKNYHKLLFEVVQGERRSWASYHNNAWYSFPTDDLQTVGNSLAEIWDNYVAQMAGLSPLEHSPFTLDERLGYLKKYQELLKQIETLQKQEKNAKQPHQKLSYHQELQNCQQELQYLESLSY